MNGLNVFITIVRRPGVASRSDWPLRFLRFKMIIYSVSTKVCFGKISLALLTILTDEAPRRLSRLPLILLLSL